MKFPLASTGAAAVLAAGLILAPGLSPAQAASTQNVATVSSQASSASVSNGSILAGAGNVATPYGMWFVPCNVFGLRLC